MAVYRRCAFCVRGRHSRRRIRDRKITTATSSATAVPSELPAISASTFATRRSSRRHRARRRHPPEFPPFPQALSRQEDHPRRRGAGRRRPASSRHFRKPFRDKEVTRGDVGWGTAAPGGVSAISASTFATRRFTCSDVERGRWRPTDFPPFPQAHSRQGELTGATVAPPRPSLVTTLRRLSSVRCRVRKLR